MFTADRAQEKSFVYYVLSDKLTRLNVAYFQGH